MVATCAVGGVINQVQAKVANQLMFQQAQKLLVKVFSFGFQSLAARAARLVALLPLATVCQANKHHTHTYSHK